MELMISTAMTVQCLSPLAPTYRKQNSFVDVDAFPNCKTKMFMSKSLKEYLDKENMFVLFTD